jgi:hypothetical protein
MTEKEAKKKWCPFSSSDTRHCIQSEGDNPSIIYVGPGKGLPKNVCIASACMMWRGETTEDCEAFPDSPPDGNGWYKIGDAYPGVGNYKRQIWQRKIKADGYCGLGGKLK